MVSLRARLGIGKKYAELAYFSANSGNSGVQKRVAFGEEKLVAPLIATA